MLKTREEAAEMWCPFVGRPTFPQPETLTHDDAKRSFACLVENCMAWRQVRFSERGAEGYCGRIGHPHQKP